MNLLQGGHNFSCRVHLSNLQGLVVGRSSSSSRRRETVIDAFVTIRKGLLEILLSFLCTGGVEKIWATEEQDISNYIIELKNRHTMIYIRIFYLR